MRLAAHARNIVCAPREEWKLIAVERPGIARLYTNYVAILAAVPLAVELIRTLPTPPPLDEIAEASLSGYVMALIGVAVLAIVSSKIAPRFGGVDDLSQGFRLAAFGMTPAWLGSVLLLVPSVGSFLALAGAIYSIYVYSAGVTELLCVPARRRAGFAAVAVAATIVIAAAMQLAIALLTGRLQIVGVQPH